MAYDFEESSNQRIDSFTTHADYTTTLSCSFWVKAESLPGSHQMVFVAKTKDGADEPNIKFLWTPAGGGDVYTVAYAGGGFNEWQANYSPTTGVWEHWYFEIDWSTNPDTHRFWVNGVEQTMTHNFGSNNITPSTTATQVINLGGNEVGDTNSADGLIAEVAFWSDNVGETRADGLYNSGSGGRADILYPTNLTEYIPLKYDLINRKGGMATLAGATKSSDHPFSYTDIGYDASSSGINVTNPVSSITVSHTVGTGLSNSILVALITTEDFTGPTAAQVVSTVTYGGVALTKYRADEFTVPQNSDGERCEVWYLLNPSSGTANIVATLAGSLASAAGVALTGISFQNVDQTTPFEAGGTANADSATNTSTSVTTVTNSAWVVDVIDAGGSADTLTANSSQTQITNTTATGSHIHATSVKPTPTAGSVTMVWTKTATTREYISTAVSMKPFVAASGRVDWPFLRHTGNFWGPSYA